MKSISYKKNFLLGRQELCGKVSASQLEGWVFDPPPQSELP